MSTEPLHQKITKVDTQARSSLLKPDAHLEKSLSTSAAHNLPAITISALQGQFLSIQCQLIGAESVLEIGTLGGYSTLHFAKTGAHVTSIEINPKHRDIALQNTKGQGFENVDIILGAGLDVLPELEKEGRKFDFVFVDASWGEQWEYFEWAVKLTRKGGCIYVDNVVREMFEEIAEGQTKESLVSRVGKDDRVQATLISTISSHKNVGDMVDGFLMAIVKG